MGPPVGVRGRDQEEDAGGGGPGGDRPRRREMRDHEPIYLHRIRRAPASPENLGQGTHRGKRGLGLFCRSSLDPCQPEGKLQPWMAGEDELRPGGRVFRLPGATRNVGARWDCQLLVIQQVGGRMIRVQINTGGPVTLRQQCPGLTTTHDPWRECAMARNNYTQIALEGDRHV